MNAFPCVYFLLRRGRGFKTPPRLKEEVSRSDGGDSVYFQSPSASLVPLCERWTVFLFSISRRNV